MATIQTDTPVLLEILMERSSDSAEDVSEHLKLSNSVAEFLIDYTPAPSTPKKR